jgi:methionyl-tRNA synthetase
MELALLSNLNAWSTQLGISPALLTVLLIVVTLWTILFKGFALWHAARNRQSTWFIAILIVNTIGILEIIYLVWFRADKRKDVTPSLFANPSDENSAAAESSAA